MWIVLSSDVKRVIIRPYWTYSLLLSNSTQLHLLQTFCITKPAMDDDQLLDYEEEQDETMEAVEKADSGGISDAKKAKVTKSVSFRPLTNPPI